ATLYYGISALKATNIIVIGHYGCGGVAAAISPRADDSPLDTTQTVMQLWIDPLRELYRNSERKEIVEYRDNSHNHQEKLAIDSPVWRALTEENVKLSVANIANSQLIQEHWANSSATPVFVYGLVYDVMDGTLKDLAVTVGPEGIPPPSSPFL
ncbi:carbonic anhydrase, partial [Cylindrobasidium torrendii FP15055 ss-10]